MTMIGIHAPAGHKAVPATAPTGASTTTQQSLGTITHRSGGIIEARKPPAPLPFPNL